MALYRLLCVVLLFVLTAHTLCANEKEYPAPSVKSSKSALDLIEARVSIPPNYAASATELIGFSQKVNQISMYYNQSMTLFQMFQWYWGAILSLGTNITGVLMTVNFEFSDGSVAVMRLRGVNSLTSKHPFEFSLLEVWDGSGNNIPFESV